MPGKPEASHVIERVTSGDDSVRMPPEGERLSGEEIATLRTWIAAGAKWQDHEVGEATRKLHWSLLLRYVERNPLRAGLTPGVNDWPWNSLRLHAEAARPAWYHDGPVRRGRDWPAYVAQPQTDAELVALRRSVERGVPYGSERWQKKAVAALGLESTLRGRGRPRNPGNEA